MKLPHSRNWLLYAAWGCAAGALLHVVAIVAGPDWFDFLGAPPEYGEMLRAGNWLYPVIITLMIALMLAVWSAYAFSVARAIKPDTTGEGTQPAKPLPYARLICGVVAAIFLIRGLIGIPLILYFLTKTGPTAINIFHLAASVFILTLGLGFVAAFRRAKPTM